MPMMDLLIPISKFAGYFIAGIMCFSIFALLYTKTTDHSEMELIGHGNQAAAYALSGSLIGYALPLASAAMHSVSTGMFLLWAGVAMMAQLSVYLVARMALKGLREQIEMDNKAYGLFLGAVAVAVGILNAGCVA